MDKSSRKALETSLQKKIESSFMKTVQRDKKVKNAYLLVNSKKGGIDLNIAEGQTKDIQANPKQAVHLASVGKLFTATIIGMLHDKGKLDFNDNIARFLDADLMNGLHIYQGKDYSAEITIRQLLMQTSGLNDVFFPLLKKIITDPSFKISVREAVQWGKVHLTPVGKPGDKHFYTDTNYYLLGLIIENITQKPFHKVVHEMIFEPLGMVNAYISCKSQPKVKATYPPASLYILNVDCIDNKRMAEIDYAGGSVVAPLDEYLIFMKALVNHQLVKAETLIKMVNDDVAMGFPTIGFAYGYSIWKPKTIPLLLPKELFCWGCVGVSGAFMFYHPQSESYVIGSFNDDSYAAKALRFMLAKVIKPIAQAQ